MAKKSDKKNKKPTESMEPAAQWPTICQYCRNHANRPSKCKSNNKYVARKQAACNKFKEVK